MPALATEPIRDHWIIAQPHAVEGRTATAADVTRRLALLELNDIDAALVPLLAAAAAEVALATGIPWRHSSEDSPVPLVRLIMKVAVRNPTASGPYTARLLDRLP